MASLERSVVIEASPEAIDEISLDAQRWPEWYPGVQQAEPDDTFPEVDGVAQVAYKTAGTTFNVKFVVTEYTPRQNIAYRLEGMITGTSRYRYVPEGTNTRLTCVYEYQVPGGFLGKALDKMVLERMNAENLEKSLQNLKALVES